MNGRLALLQQLRILRKDIRRDTRKRDRLIVELRGHHVRRDAVASAAGLSPSQVTRICKEAQSRKEARNRNDA